MHHSVYVQLYTSNNMWLKNDKIGTTIAEWHKISMTIRHKQESSVSSQVTDSKLKSNMLNTFRTFLSNSWHLHDIAAIFPCLPQNMQTNKQIWQQEWYTNLMQCTKQVHGSKLMNNGFVQKVNYNELSISMYKQ